MFKDRIRTKDIKAIWWFMIAWPIAKMRAFRQKDVWLLSERPNEARDNGYWMFKYIKENTEKQDVYYVINKNATDKSRIDSYGSIIEFGSFKHYIIYWLATKDISAHIDLDSPNSRVSNFLETHGLLKNKRVFLQHGITKDKISFGYYSVSRADLLVCAAKPEYEFCKKEFGYPEGAVQLLGFARFDGLGVCKPKRQVLLMPTWRAWLANLNLEQFLVSDYYQKYQSLLNNSNLHKLLMNNDLELIFYPHSDMQKFISLFYVNCSRIKIASAKEYDIQTLLNESVLLITDYSSVAFDMAYMCRPVFYYQFDYQKYREGQHAEGYYSYEKDGFGPVIGEEYMLIEALYKCVINKLQIEKKYYNRIENFFALRDRKNCKRIYEAIKKL